MWGPLSAFLSSVTWAWGSAYYSRLSLVYTAFAVNFARALIGLPLFILAVFIEGGSIQGGLQLFGALEGRHFFWLTLSMISSYGLGDVCFYWSSYTLGVPGALAIACTYPIWTTLAGAIWHHEIPTFLQWSGLFLTVAGVILVILGGQKALAADLSKPRVKIWGGVGLALATSIFWTLNSYSVAQAGKDVSVNAANAYRMLVALFLCFGFGKLMAPKSTIRIPVSQLKRYLPLFGMEAFGGSFFYLYGLSHSKLVIAAPLTSLAPILAVPVAWHLKTEKMNRIKVLGVLVAVVGVCALIAK